MIIKKYELSFCLGSLTSLRAYMLYVTFVTCPKGTLSPSSHQDSGSCPQQYKESRQLHCSRYCSCRCSCSQRQWGLAYRIHIYTPGMYHVYTWNILILGVPDAGWLTRQ